MIFDFNNLKNLFKRGQVSKTIKNKDVFVFGRKNSTLSKGYQPVAIEGKDLIDDLTRKVLDEANISIGNINQALPRFTFTFNQEGTENPVLGSIVNTTGETFSAIRAGVGQYVISCDGNTQYFDSFTRFLINGFMHAGSGAGASPSALRVYSNFDGTPLWLKVWTYDTGVSYLALLLTDDAGTPVEWSAHMLSPYMLSFEVLS